MEHPNRYAEILSGRHLPTFLELRTDAEISDAIRCHEQG